MDNHKKSKLGVKVVRDYLSKEKKCSSVLGRKQNETGYDLVACCNGRLKRIEVKTSEGEFGIPDMHETEFVMRRGKLYLVADELYIVRLGAKKRALGIDVLTRKQVDAFADKHTIVKRIRTKKLQVALKNDRDYKLHRYIKLHGKSN